MSICSSTVDLEQSYRRPSHSDLEPQDAMLVKNTTEILHNREALPNRMLGSTTEVSEADVHNSFPQATPISQACLSTDHSRKRGSSP